MKSNIAVVSLTVSHFLVAAVGGLIAWQNRPEPVKPGPSIEKTASSGRAGREMAGNAAKLIPENPRYQTQWSAENRDKDAEIARRVAAITDMRTEMNRMAGLARENALGGDDMSCFYEAFKRWLKEDAPTALEWLGSERLGWLDGDFMQMPAYAHVGFELPNYLAAIRKWPPERQRLAFKSISQAGPENAFSQLQSATERQFYLDSLLERFDPTKFAALLPQLLNLDGTERAGYLDRMKRSAETANTDSSCSEDDLRILESEPVLADAVKAFRQKKEIIRIEKNTGTDLESACRDLRQALLSAGKSEAEAQQRIEQLRTERSEPRSNPEFFNNLQSIHLNGGDVKQAVLNAVGQASANGAKLADWDVAEAAAIAMRIDPQGATEALIEALSPQMAVSRVQWGIEGGTDAAAKMWKFRTESDCFPYVDPWIKNPDFDSYINFPAKSFFTENETAAMAWARSLSKPAVRSFALHEIAMELRSQGRKSEADGLETEAQEARK